VVNCTQQFLHIKIQISTNEKRKCDTSILVVICSVPTLAQYDHNQHLGSGGLVLAATR